MPRTRVSLFIAIATFFASTTLTAQQTTTVRGTVTADDGRALAGAVVRVEGTTTSTLTDAGGAYSLEVRGEGEASITTSFLGYSPGAQTVNLSGATLTVDFVLGRDPLGLDALIVTGVANENTKIESSVSITTLDPTVVAASAPRTTAEIFRTIPGIRSEASGGDGNTNITVRGVPISAGGSKYLQLQEDGLPIFLFGDIAFATSDIFLRNDANLARIEAIRGGSASTLATNSPAGIINFISKTGETASGSVATTVGLDHDMNRLDFDYGSPFGDGLAFHVGGFLRSGEGPRDVGYTANRGGQLKANLTKLFDGGYARLYFKYLDDRTPAIMPMPIQVSGTNDDPDWEDAPGLDATLETTHSVFLQSNFGLDANGAPRSSDVTDGMRALSRAIGAEVAFDLGDGWSVESRARFAVNSGAFRAPFTAAVGPTASILTSVGESIDRDLTGATLTVSHTGDPFSGSNLQVITLFDTELQNFDNTMLDTRISKQVEGVTVSAGLFKGIQRVAMDWLWSNFLMEIQGENAGLIDITTAADGTISESGQYSYGVPAFGNCCQVQFNSTYDVTAPYGAIEIEASDQLTLSGSFRVDIGDVTGVGHGGVQGTADVNNDGEIAPIEESVSVVDQSQDNPVDYEYDYVSFSFGANVLLNEDRAIFGRFSRGSSAKADRAIFPTGIYIEPIQFGPKDEIEQAELGIKQQFANGGLFITGFYANTTEEGGFEATTQQVIETDYQALGVEVEGAFAFDALDLRGAATFTDAEITSGDNDGNTPRRQPKLMYNLLGSYQTEPGHNFGLSLIGQTRAYAQDVNELVMPAYAILNGFVGIEVSGNLRFVVGANNLFDSIGITESEEGSITENQVNLVRARSITGRSLTASVEYGF
ncbi:MAG: TonB-dependent receptor [Gemmatimonadota bacterium]